jgi:hypothetical protein
MKMTKWLYYIAFGLLLFSKGIGLYDGTMAFKIFLIPALICLALKMVMTRYNKREAVLTALLLVSGAASYLLSGEKGLLIYILLMAAMKSVPVRGIFTAGLVSWGIGFMGLTISSLFHLYNTPFKVHEKLGLGHMFRWGLGYVHPNVLHVSFLILLFFIVYVFQEKFNWKWALAMFAANCYVFLYSVSYAGFGMVSVYLVLQLYWSYRKKVGRAEAVLSYLVFPGCALLSLAGPLVLEGKIYALTDSVLNNRLHLAENFLKVENFSLFGLRIENIITNNLTMDNAYVFAFITHGCIFFLGIFIVYQLAIRRMIRNNEGTRIVMTVVILLYGLVEPFPFNISIKNLSVIFIGAFLWGETEAENSEIILLPGILKRINDFKEILRGKKRTLIAVSLAAGIVCCICCTKFTTVPEAYMVQRIDCEIIGKEFQTFPEDYAQNHPEVKVIDYVDDTTYMEVFSGNIVRIELARECISAFLLGMSGMMIIISGLILGRYLVCGSRNEDL